MVNKANEISSLGRLSREEWLQEALNYIRHEASGELRIDRLTAALGVTKGSFYHHFNDRQDFMDSVLQYWNQVHNLSVARALAASDGEPKEKLRTIMKMVYEGEFTSYDLPLRAWAMNNEHVRSFIEQSDCLRLDTVRALFADLGFTGEELEVRTRIFMTFVSLEVAVYDRLPKDEILKQVDTRLEILTRP